MPETIETNTSVEAIPQHPFSHRGAKVMKYIAVLLFLAAIALVVFAIVKKKQAPNHPQINPPLYSVFLTKDKALAEGLPADIVTAVDSNPTILQSYTTASDNGVSQSTVQFGSSLNYNQLINLYKDYFKKNGWGQLKVEDQGEVATLSYVKQLDQATVVITNRREVDVTFIHNPGNKNSTSK